MSEKILPFDYQQIKTLIEKHPTPFYIYDEKSIRENAKRLISSFNWAPQFKEFFAVKALPNPHILKLLKEEGIGADCSSLPELLLASKAGITGENIMFTSNDTPLVEYKKAKELGAIINLDDISHLDFIDKNIGLPELLCFRYNPGSARSGNAIIGKPEEAKYGLTKDQLFEGYKQAKKRGVKRFGLHTMIISNELNPEYFIETGKMLLELVQTISREVGISFEFINLGGGIGIPYRPEQQPVDLAIVNAGLKQAYEKTIVAQKLPPLKIYLECGRMITGPYGFLVTTVLHKKETYKSYAGVDACMANLMRPGMYGAYHHITVLGKENQKPVKTYDVTGSLCENNDKFAIDRLLPEIAIGDILAIHDTGAHGHAMGFNYNGKLRSAELLLRPDGSVKQIRRAETIDDYFATIDFSSL